MKNKGYKVNNIDVSITLEKPKIAEYIDEMRKNLSRYKKNKVSFKGTDFKTNS